MPRQIDILQIDILVEVAESGWTLALANGGLALANGGLRMELRDGKLVWLKP